MKPRQPGESGNDAALSARVPNPADKFWKMREGA